MTLEKLVNLPRLLFPICKVGIIIVSTPRIVMRVKVLIFDNYLE